MKKKVIYFSLLILAIIFVSTAYYSYAFFTHKLEEHGKLNLVVGTLDYQIESKDLKNHQITVPAHTTKEIIIKITSLNTIDSKYELYYLLDKSELDIEVGYLSSTDDLPVGIIEKNASKFVKVIIHNNESSEQNIKFGVEGGFTSQNLVLKKGNHLPEVVEKAALVSLAIGGKDDTYQLVPSFEESVKSYRVTLEETEINIKATAVSSNIKISGDIGKKSLNWGENTFTITVTFQEETSTYQLLVDNQRPTAPVITGGNSNWVSNPITISVKTPGDALSEVDHYEYYLTSTDTPPDDNTKATDELPINNTQLEVTTKGTSYIYYRTVSKHGNKSKWSSSAESHLETLLYYFGNEYESVTGGWFISDISPHRTTTNSWLQFVDTNLKKEATGMYNRVTSVATVSNLTTHNAINVKNHKQICFDFSYYIPQQDRTGQSVYLGLAINSYATAHTAINLTEGTSAQQDTIQCVNINVDSALYYPFIEIYNGHTVNPYTGYAANTYIYLRRVYLR